jgi:raffinose/stachyose/melibiose transport system permease protein
MKHLTKSLKNRKKLTRKGSNNLFIVLFLLPTMICYCVYYLYPIVTVFYTSFCQWDYKNATSPQLFPIKELFNNYQYIFTKYPFFWEAFTNSVKWALCGIFIQMPLAVIAAILLSRSLPGWKFARNVYIIPSVISSAAIGLIFLQIYNPRYGVVNQIIKLFAPGFSENILLLPKINFWAMTFSYIFFAGSSMILVMGHIFSIPTEIYEAANLDGAIGLKKDIYITLPLIKDIVKTITILAATSGFLLYNEVYLLTKGAAGTKSISYIIRDLAIVTSRTQYGRANTVGVVQIVMGMLIILAINLMFSINKMKFKSRKGQC